MATAEKTWPRGTGSASLMAPGFKARRTRVAGSSALAAAESRQLGRRLSTLSQTAGLHVTAFASPHR